MRIIVYSGRDEARDESLWDATIHGVIHEQCTTLFVVAPINFTTYGTHLCVKTHSGRLGRSKKKKLVVKSILYEKKTELQELKTWIMNKTRWGR